MRTWGRVPQHVAGTGVGIGFFEIGESPIGGGGPQDYVWVEVTTDENGYNDAVWLTALAQVLQLGLNESPIFGSTGIPAQQSAVTQVLPDYYVMLTQQQFSAYFAALLITRTGRAPPTYRVNATANPGAILQSPVPT